MRRPRVGVRSRLLLAVTGALVLALVLGVAAFNVLLDQRLQASAASLARAQAETEAASLRIAHGRIAARERPDEAPLANQVWIFQGPTALEAPRVAAEFDRAARALAASGGARALEVRDTARMYAAPVVQDGRRYGTVVAAVSLDPYQESANDALVGSLVLAGLLLGAIAIVSWWMLGRALLPVSRMTSDAASWSDHDLDRRFHLGEPYDELTRLGATLDTMLERIAASLRHEQRLTAELSHELRTPLARITAEAELALRRERASADYRQALTAIAQSAAQMSRTVDALVSAAREEAGLSRSVSDARAAVRSAVEHAEHASPPGNGIRVLVTLPDEPVPVAIDGELVERIVQPLVDNAFRYGRSSVSVSLVREGRSALVDVADDGPGVDAVERTRIFEPGARGSAAEGREDGAGLGLSLARRLARSVGAELAVAPSTAGGRFILRFPLDA